MTPVSSEEVVMMPVGNDITIRVDVGSTVELPPEYQNWYFKNPRTGHKESRVKLNDHGTYVCTDGADKGSYNP
ncbi:hypothetical protein KP509_1Z128200 [Ceratopteris richardii]|nr:hypothetical protein KP509_1Z128200 [Ceratopteris richardii]KAH6557207.1 hypothetical protein KP509_1Z128200 [Ceratopteris richardii]